MSIIAVASIPPIRTTIGTLNRPSPVTRMRVPGSIGSCGPASAATDPITGRVSATVVSVRAFTGAAVLGVRRLLSSNAVASSDTLGRNPSWRPDHRRERSSTERLSTERCTAST